MADDDQSLPTEFDSRFRSVYNPPSPIPGQDTPLYSRANIPKNDTLLERFGGLPTEGSPEAFYTSPINEKGGTLIEAPRPKKIKEGKYELTPVDMNVAPQSVKEVLLGYDKPVGRYQTWPERLARIVGKGAFDIVGGIPAGVTAPRDAFTGKLQVTNPETGMPTEEAVQRSIEALSVPFKAGTIGVAGVAGPKLGSTAISDAYKNKYLPNGVEKPEAFDRVLPAVRNLETGKISTTKRGNEHADILTRLWEKEGGSPHADTMSIYEDMLPRHEMGYYDPLKKQFHPRDSEEWKNIDSPDLNPRQAMRSGMVFSDTQKSAQLLSSLTAAQRKAYNREAFRNGGQLLVPEASEEAINRLVNEPAYKKWDKAATDAGFTTDAYHGTHNFEGTTIEPKRAGKTEFYSTDEPKLAEDYSKQMGFRQQILPLKLNTSNYHIIDAKGKQWDQVNEEAIKAAKAEGKSGVTIKNLKDAADDEGFVEPATVHITFDPATVRSRFAKFNPDDIKKNGLLLSDSSKPAQVMSATLQEHLKDSVVKDRLYHGTKSGGQIKEFKPSNSGEFGPGVYLTDNPDTAHFYAEHVARGEEGASIVPAYATLKNPFTVTKQDWIKMTQNKTPREVQAKLKKQGYDGIIGIGINGVDKQFVAFEPNQVKSAFALSETSKPAQAYIINTSNGNYTLTPTSNPNINNENDVPYGAGASNTPSGYPVHIDKRIPQYDEKLKLPSGEPANLHSYLQVHEITEHQLMKRGMSYEQAHKQATENEKRAVKRNGLDWNTYEHIMDGYLKETEHEHPKNPPKNLYLKPYPHDKQVLLKKLEK